MTDTALETQLLRLSDAIVGFREDEAVRYCQAPREAICATLADLVSRGRLRESGRRYYRVRDA